MIINKSKRDDKLELSFGGQIFVKKFIVQSQRVWAPFVTFILMSGLYSLRFTKGYKNEARKSSSSLLFMTMSFRNLEIIGPIQDKLLKTVYIETSSVIYLYCDSQYQIINSKIFSKEWVGVGVPLHKAVCVCMCVSKTG